jgi:hypothetical protein
MSDLVWWFGGGMKVVLGRGVEANVGGFWGAVEGLRSASETLIVRWIPEGRVLEWRYYSYVTLALRRG